jgi:site-specific recombinase
MRVRDLGVRSLAVRAVEFSSEALVYVVIVGAFTSVVFLAWLALLLIW